jgi:hypothetical protein
MGRKNVKDSAVEGGNEGSPERVLSEGLSRLLPRLMWEVESHVLGDGKTPRRPLCLSFFWQDGSLKACLRDRDMGRVAFLSADGLAALLHKLDQALESSTLDWRKDKYAV